MSNFQSHPSPHLLITVHPGPSSLTLAEGNILIVTRSFTDTLHSTSGLC